MRSIPHQQHPAGSEGANFHHLPCQIPAPVCQVLRHPPQETLQLLPRPIAGFTAHSLAHHFKMHPHNSSTGRPAQTVYLNFVYLKIGTKNLTSLDHVRKRVQILAVYRTELQQIPLKTHKTSILLDASLTSANSSCEEMLRDMLLIDFEQLKVYG